MQNKNDSWSSEEQYEKSMGRWSNLVAEKFLAWLNIQPNSTWLDVGCGTGALTKLILQSCKPKKIISIDLSSEFIFHAKQSIADPVVSFQVGSAEALEQETNSVDAVVSGIMLNFVPKPEAAINYMLRVTNPGEL